MVTASAVLDTVSFREKIPRLAAGLPMQIRSDVCFSCMSDENPSIIAGCSVVVWKTYRRRDLLVCFQKTDGYLDIITSSFNETVGNQLSYEGYGDNTKASSFLFTESEPFMHFMEYNNQTSITRLRDKMGRTRKRTLCEETNEPVKVYNISCEESQMTPYTFASIAQKYRTGQLENFMNPSEFNETEGTFTKLVNAEMLYRAVWIAKVLADPVKIGTFPVYTNCGKYRWIFLLPLAASVCILVLIFVISNMVKLKYSYRGNFAKVLDSWYHWARLIQVGESVPSLSLHSSGRHIRQRPFDKVSLNFDDENDIIIYKI